MNIDDRQNEVELHGLMNMQKTKAIYDATLGRIHPENTAELAAQGALLSPSMESRAQAVAHGQVHMEKTIADELRELLGVTQQSNEVGLRKHDGSLAATSATKYGSLVEALKKMVAEAPPANEDPMNNFDMKPENELNVDEAVGAETRESLMSEVQFLRDQVMKLQKEAAAKQAMKDNRFSSRGGTQTNRFGI